MCPNCKAPFVAPPGPPNLDLAPADTQAASPAPRRPWWPVFLALGLAVLGLVGIVVSLLQSSSLSGPRTASAKPPPQSMLMVEAPQRQLPLATTAKAEPDQGIFHVQAQAQRPPVIAIGNASDETFRLQLQDQTGKIETEWIPPQSQKDVVVPSGAYSAMIDAPNNTLVHAAQGTVQVKDFHHYEADFYIGAPTAHQSFYIGD